MRVATRSAKEMETEEAHIAGRLDAFNGIQFLLLLLVTFCLYICFRKKKIGGFIVTSRRVISVAVIQDATGQQVQYEQANYFIRHFAYERHFYDQPTYTCCDYLTCQPCINCLMCTPLTPRVGIMFRFTSYPLENVFQEGNIGSLCFSLCINICRSCQDTCLQSCCGDGFWGYEGATVYVEMKVDYKTGLRRVNNVVAAVLFYHPAKNTNFGRAWDPNEPYSHPRLLSVSTKEESDFNKWDEEQRVPIERLESKDDVGTWGIVVNESILDGYAPKIKFCTCFVICFSIATLGIGYCILRCQYDHCAPIERVYYVLTDRRLIRYTLHTKGAKTVPKLQGDEEGKTEFAMEISSWVMATIHTFRYSEERMCLACFGCECLCCAKRAYLVRLHTPFGMVVLQDEGRDSLEAFLKSLMNQHYEAPLRGVTNHMRLGQDQENLRPEEGDDVVYIPPPEGESPSRGEQPLARIEGELFGGLLWLLSCIMTRMGTCCCFPRSFASNLYVTDMRVITSMTAKVPCTGKVMDTFTEYYALSRVRRVRAAERYKCSCCGCIHCCPSQVFAISTDNEFEFSMEGEEVYTIKEVFGVEGGDPNEQMQNITAAFALMNTHEGWLEKKVLDSGRWSEFVQQDFRLEGQSV